MQELDKWNKELERLSAKSYKEVDQALFKFYKQALKDLKSEIKNYIENYEMLSFSKRLEAERQIKVANDIDRILKELESKTDPTIRDYVKGEAESGYYGTWYAMEGANNMQVDFSFLNERYIESLVNKKVAGKNFSKRLYQHRTQLANNVTRELLNGAVKGEGYAMVAKRVGELTEATYKQALRIARTEGGRVQSTTKQRAYEEAKKKGVNLEKMWMATLDKKTRRSHGMLDGQIVEVDEEFKYGGYKADGPRLFGNAALDINCRCTTVAVVNGIKPDSRLDNENKEIFQYTKYSEWAANKGIINKPSKFDELLSTIDLNANRRTLSKQLLKALGLEDVPVSIKKIQPHGYCSIGLRPDGTVKIGEYALNSQDLRSNTHQVKTAFHEAYHAANHGRLSDMRSGAFKDLNWLDVEETFAETSSHYAIKRAGFTESLSPSYAEKLVNTLPRLKQTAKFKSAKFITDFGEIAWNDRLAGQSSTWSGLANELSDIKHDWKKYGLGYEKHILQNKDELFDKMLGNMPQYDQPHIRDAMKSDLDSALKKAKDGSNLNGNEQLVYSNILINAMNQIGVR